MEVYIFKHDYVYEILVCTSDLVVIGVYMEKSTSMDTLEARILEFLVEYGERAYAVLRAALDSYLSSKETNVFRLGDFSYREIVARLKSWGISYNPSMLLRILERDYGVIETSYKSNTQHWWKFVNVRAVISALEHYVSRGEPVENNKTEMPEDIEIALLATQIASLNPFELYDKLRKLAKKDKLTKADMLFLRKIAFNEIELITSILRRAENIGYESDEIDILKSILSLAYTLSKKLLTTSRLEVSARNNIVNLANSGSLRMDKINKKNLL